MSLPPSYETQGRQKILNVAEHGNEDPRSPKRTTIEYYHKKLILHKIKIVGIRARCHDPSTTIILPSHVKSFEKPRHTTVSQHIDEEATNMGLTIQSSSEGEKLIERPVKRNIEPYNRNGDERATPSTSFCQSSKKQVFETQLAMPVANPVTSHVIDGEGSTCRSSFKLNFEGIFKHWSREKKRSFSLTDTTLDSIGRASVRSCSANAGYATVDSPSDENKKAELSPRKFASKTSLASKISCALRRRHKDAWLMRSHRSQETKNTGVMEMVFFDVK